MVAEVIQILPESYEVTPVKDIDTEATIRAFLDKVKNTPLPPLPELPDAVELKLYCPTEENKFIFPRRYRTCFEFAGRRGVIDLGPRSQESARKIRTTIEQMGARNTCICDLLTFHQHKRTYWVVYGRSVYPRHPKSYCHRWHRGHSTLAPRPRSDKGKPRAKYGPTSKTIEQYRQRLELGDWVEIPQRRSNEWFDKLRRALNCKAEGRMLYR